MKNDDGSTGGSSKLIALGIFVAFAALVAIFHSRIVGDFWPPDRSSVGPNLLAAVLQAGIVLIVLALIWPPTRRRIHRFVDGKLASVHSALSSIHSKVVAHGEAFEKHQQRIEDLHAELRAKNDDHSRDVADLHAKVDKLIGLAEAGPKASRGSGVSVASPRSPKPKQSGGR